MNDEQLNETEVRIDVKLGELKSELKADIAELRIETHDGLSGVAEAIDGVLDQLTDHERRIQKLEEQSA